MSRKTSWQSKAELPPEATAHLATLWYQAMVWVTSVPPANRYSQRTHHGCTLRFESHWRVTPAAPSRIAQPCNAQMAPAPGATRQPYVPTPDCAIARAGSLTESFLLTHSIASSSSQRLVLCVWVSHISGFSQLKMSGSESSLIHIHGRYMYLKDPIHFGQPALRMKNRAPAVLNRA